MNILISDNRDLKLEEVVALYKANKWTSADKPNELYNGLINSHSLITAWDDKKLVGLENAISDGHLMVYYPHLLVLPTYQGNGIGKLIVAKMQEKYGDFHMQMLTADGGSIEFYEKTGFVKAGKTQSMWIYDGDDH